jgi:glycosyltransferase involved in cell wall biosynthesis
LSRLATNGLRIPPDHVPLVQTDPAAAADTVLRLFHDKDERHRLGQSARDNVQQHFTWSAAAAKLDALLRDAALNAPASRSPRNR